MTATIRKIGNSEGVIIPKEILERLNLKSGDSIDFVETENGLIIRPANDKFARQMDAARRIMDQYKVALSELAK
ncbi:MAG: AbrB/MazE/SpoVT family DNA-binding domain-containing protein [Zhengella sp.]|uniref:AbrB/MazE/SpoVT family DNA-binding domain-containing protein n=1 Tax=Zhengella sp. TaxID=2282762 RepID=UPI001DB5D9E3|nr:AbrB/MazE/SpoVT family DNA-binding domain-containing protein [Notoacmeibacter sp.]MCC0026312.1 AbrB/MazE/SpoVT family DNA-binding domain-containing protein [Brucellaceae bacterium]